VPESGGLYDALEVVGIGSYATVCRATVRATGAEVALKVLNPEHVDDVSFVNRARDEARVLSQLDHPNIIRVFALHDYDGRPVVEMEYVRGVALDRVLRRFPDGLPGGVVLSVGARVAGALEHAYSAPMGPDGAPLHVVHRDIKPGNIVLSVQGEVKVVDFNIAKGEFVGREAKSLYLVAGSRGFVPPERAAGGESTAAIDVYALGLTLFSLLTGRTLTASTRQDRHDADVERQLAHLRVDGLPDDLHLELRVLIADLARFESAARPDHAQAAERLLDLLLRSPLDHDLPAFAAEHVVPLAPAPRQTPSFELDAVEFLTREPPSPADPLSPGSAEQLIRRRLSTPSWPGDQRTLQRIIERSSDFPAAPLLEVLDRATAPGWRFWVRRASPAEIEAALVLLADHPTPQVIAYARRLIGHADPRVSTAARFLVALSGS